MAKDRCLRTAAGMRRSDRAAGRAWVLALGALLGGLAAADPSAAARLTQKVVLAGEPAPGTGGAVFAASVSGQNGLDEAVINTTGDVAFGASFTGANSGAGVWLRHAGVLSAVAVSGQNVAGLGTLSAPWSDSWEGPVINNSSTVVFGTFKATGGSAANAILQKTLTGPLTVLVKQGDAAPGTSGAFDTFDDMVENDGGDVVFIAAYIEFGVTKSGVFLRPSTGGLQAILRNGDVLPGIGGGSFCGVSTGDVDGPFMNNNGVIAFIIPDSSVCGGTGTGGLFARRPGQGLEAFVLVGDAAPAGIGGTITDIGIGRPGLDDNNTVAFKAELSGTGPCSNGDPCAILTKTLGASSMQSCVAGGSAAPGTAGTFVDFNPPAVNHGGLALIEAATTGDPAITEGLFTCQGGVVHAVALQGDPKPGTSVTFSNNLSDATPSDSGLFAFVDTVDSGGTAANEGVFVGGASACGGIDPATTLCVDGGRFAITATFSSPATSGSAQAVQLTPDTGYFWFFSSTNVELIVKSLNACAFNQHFWVFAGGLTDVGVVMTVRDTHTGTVRTYTNLQGHQFQPITDTSAFASCSSADAAVGKAVDLAAERKIFEAMTSDLAPRSLAGTSLLLNNDRFKIDVTWRTNAGQTGAGTPVVLTSDSGYFWFFSSNNVEMVIKVLNACSFNQHYWVYAAGLTDQQVSINVLDTKTGTLKPYVNPLGVPFRPILDSSAFATCP